jgi:competence protein ComEC
MGWGIEFMLAVGRWVSSLPGAVSLISAWPVSALVSLTLGGLWIALWRTRWRWFGLVPSLTAAALVLTCTPPDLFVGRDGLTVALRGTDHRLHFVRPPSDKYSAEEWLKRDGDSRTLDRAVADGGGGACDADGCIIEAGALRIAAPLTPAALEEDCAANEIVISAVPTRHRCSGPALVIDRFDVARNGAYAIWLTPGIAIETAQTERGLRPWSTPPPRRQYRRMRPTSLPWMRTRSEP